MPGSIVHRTATGATCSKVHLLLGIPLFFSEMSRGHFKVTVIDFTRDEKGAQRAIDTATSDDERRNVFRSRSAGSERLPD